MALIQLQPRAFDCTPSSLLNSVPCLECLSEKELLAALFIVLLQYNDLTVPQAMSSSACFTCMSKKQMLQAIVTIWGNSLLGRDFDAAALLADYKCVRCASDKQLMAGILYMFCLYLNTPPAV